MRRGIRKRRGTAIVLAIVLSVVITGLVSALAWVAGQQAQTTGSMSKLDQAFFAAEAGLQRVAYYGKYGTLASMTPPLTGTCNGYNYSTRWTVVSPTRFDITSVGSTGTTSCSLTATLTFPLGPAAMATAGDFDSKN